ncbi:hypothetical protein ACOSUW_004745, partial [Escherichia coli]
RICDHFYLLALVISGFIKKEANNIHHVVICWFNVNMYDKNHVGRACAPPFPLLCLIMKR